MKECISIKTDYQILSSLIRVPSLIEYAKSNKYKSLGIIDDNLSGSIEFIRECEKNSIKPVVGLDTIFRGFHVYLYAKNESGLKSLFKLNTFLIDNELNIVELTRYSINLLCVISYDDRHLYNELAEVIEVFIGYKNENEKKNALIITSNTVYFNLVLSLNKEDTKYINYLNMIKDNVTYNDYSDFDYSSNYLCGTDLSNFTNLIDIKLSPNKNLIPHYDDNIKDSYKYLETLAIKGLSKRLNGNISEIYKNRLLYELNIIKNMNFVDYFLIVYDYVKFSINNNILVGPGRGSAAGSLVTYSLGITSIDPIKYNLLFERFLNPERVTMPDIDIDFDASKRMDVINYVKSRYGEYNVMPIMTHGTMTSKQVLLSVSKLLNIDISDVNSLIDPKKSLKDNLTNEVIRVLNSNIDIKKVYYDSLKLEGLKKHISTHAAGVIICKERLDSFIPIVKSGNSYLTGYTMNYLEELGLLKMDFLAIKDLTTISGILSMLPNKISINNIDLNNSKVLSNFTNANTTGVFQFESVGMKQFLSKLKPSKFEDLVVALALYRPGPMQNIDSFIRRKNNLEKVNYIVPDLEPILKETYGIIVYQEQIMQIFTTIASYSYSEADLIRRAISKKKESVILEEKERFVERAVNNNYKKDDAIKIYDLIIKFANYGFNKSHSVAYALVGYQMMYLKVLYPEFFYSCLLSINIGSFSKTKEYIDEAKLLNINIVKPSINLSKDNYFIEGGIVMPITVIKNIGTAAALDIIKERSNGEFNDFFDFVARTYGKSVNSRIIENLIYAGALDCFGVNRATLINNIKPALIYAELVSGLDSSLVAKPSLDIVDEFSNVVLMNKELELYGYYVSKHPASKFNSVKAKDINEYFDKKIIIFGLLESVHTIKTKKGDSMAFLKLSDETGYLDCTLFPNRIDYANRIKNGDLLKVYGHVEKRLDKYQVVINKLEVINYR